MIILSEKLDDLRAFNCSSSRSTERGFMCVKPITGKAFYGVKTLITRLPDGSEVILAENGLHTKILGDGAILDYFELGGPVRVVIDINTQVLNKGGGSLTVPIPPTNSHQEIVSIESNYPFNLVKEDDLSFGVFELPPSGSKKRVVVDLRASLELKGYSILSSCKNGCEPVVSAGDLKSIEVESGELSSLVSEISDRNNVIDILQRVFRFLARNVRYRVNFERFGGFYALKMGFGACDEISDLTVKILEKAGFAARYVKGLYIKDYGKVEGHAWVELRTVGGWIPFDPTAKIFGVGMRWVKFSHELKSKKDLISVEGGLRLIGAKVNLI